MSAESERQLPLLTEIHQQLLDEITETIRQRLGVDTIGFEVVVRSGLGYAKIKWGDMRRHD